MDVMHWILIGLSVVGLIPLGLALRANRGTSLTHALVWTTIAWLSWGVAFWTGDLAHTYLDPWRFCALALAGCAGVAVLGARRPHVGAWNLVVLTLFAVMVWPLLETLFLGARAIDWLRIAFLGATLAVGVLNYLPTRFGPAALVMLMAGGGEITLLFAPDAMAGLEPTFVFDALLMIVPWVAWACTRQNSAPSDFDRVWLSFRDRWGLVWAQRVREQFNNAAENAGWPVKLRWRGLRRESEVDELDLMRLLRATLQRFLPSD